MTQKSEYPVSVGGVVSVYTETVISYGTRPRKMATMRAPDGYAKITGPCGDTMEIYLRISADNVIEDACFMTDGCITSIASAGMAVEMGIDRPLSEVRKISQDNVLDRLGGLPEDSRHCALLAANTLHAAIDDFATMKSQPWKRMYRK